MAVQCWQVVGGEDKGGILVRQGEDLASQKEGRRLSHGALVKELIYRADTGRLKYELMKGTGPMNGWVSINIFGKVLCSKVEVDIKPAVYISTDTTQTHWTGVQVDTKPAVRVKDVRTTEAQWSATDKSQPVAKIWKRDLTVRTMDGSIVFTKKAVTSKTPVSELLSRICEKSNVRYDLAQVLYESSVLSAGKRLGDCIITPSQDPLEMILLKASMDVGPAITSQALSRSRIEVLGKVPAVGEECHFDREYTFTSLGDFAKRPRMRYVKTSNDDKFTPADAVMWRLVARMPVTVGLNFRSETHVTNTGASAWLEEGGWQRSTMASTVSTGHPNGPYSGPVYFKVFEAGTIDLMGSACDEGTYFVFVELR